MLPMTQWSAGQESGPTSCIVCRNDKFDVVRTEVTNQ